MHWSLDVIFDEDSSRARKDFSPLLKCAKGYSLQLGIVNKIASSNYIIIMDGIKFEWDPKKNKINKEKHHVSFEEAQTVFYDDEAKVIN